MRVKALLALAAAFAAVSVSLAISQAPAKQARPNAQCSLASTGLVPLTDMGSRRYRGYRGGLYPGGVNRPSAKYLKKGQVTSRQVHPINGKIVVGTDSHELARRDCGGRHPLRILALRDCAHDDVSICDDAHEPIVFHDGDRSDVLRFHQLGDLCQRSLRSHSTWSTSHHIANFGAHLAPFGLSLVVPRFASVKPLSCAAPRLRTSVSWRVADRLYASGTVFSHTGRS